MKVNCEQEIFKQYEVLFKACREVSEVPIELTVDGKGKLYQKPKILAKDGFVEKFCQ